MSLKSYYIREQFPDKKQRIDTLIREDPEFQELCEDYDACVNALRYWTQTSEPVAETRVKEYRVLIRELEEEIIQVLEDPIPSGQD